jgi:hypothetical protein
MQFLVLTEMKKIQDSETFTKVIFIFYDLHCLGIAASSFFFSKNHIVEKKNNVESFNKI